MTAPPLQHICPAYTPSFSGHGAALDGCMVYDGVHWWAGNGEYASAVRFCPFCGIELRTLLPVPPDAPAQQHSERE